MTKHLSRRWFLKTCLAIAAVGTLRPRVALAQSTRVGRATRDGVTICTAPDQKSEVVARKKRDELLRLYYEIDGAGGVNKRWWRTWGGYVHSAYVQPMDVRLNDLADVPPAGAPASVTVPFVQAYRGPSYQPIYRLYYGSVHWVQEIVDGPDGSPWYRLVDHYGRDYVVPTDGLHVHDPKELSPLSVDVAPEEKRIEVSISQQSLQAYEGDQVVFACSLSTGVPQLAELEEGQISSETPIGEFHVQSKTSSRHMGATPFEPVPERSPYPGVPWVCFFHVDGYSFHGTYWHDNYGVRMSSGCVNLRPADALWLYRWTTPVVPFEEREVKGWGTLAVIRA